MVAGPPRRYRDTIGGKITWSSSDKKLNPVPNVCTTPITGGQWVKGDKYPYNLIVVNNSQATEVPTQGDLVGYQVRFVDHTGPRTLVKLMTDGLLLRELESDPLLERIYRNASHAGLEVFLGERGEEGEG